MNIKRLGFNVAIALLVFSGGIDAFLWVSQGYLIPCWTVTAFSFSFAGLLMVVRKLI